jgi:VanZ family protein
VKDLFLLQAIQPQYNTSRPALDSRAAVDWAILQFNSVVIGTMEGAANEPATVAAEGRVVPTGQRWFLETHSDNNRLAVTGENDHAGKVLEQVEAGYITAAILASIAFLYASTVPWIFAAPDFDSRLERVAESWHWNFNQPLDPVANVLAFIPVGFLWSAAWNLSAFNRRSRALETLKVVAGCLALAVLAETLQFWIPLRDPSIRDVLALEFGAIAGCGLWLATGQSLTAWLCGLVERLRIARPRLFQLRLPVLLGAGYLACVILAAYANPIRLFLTYRDLSTFLQHITVSRLNLPAQWPQGVLQVLLVGGVATVLLGGACGIGGRAVRLLKRSHLAR